MTNGLAYKSRAQTWRRVLTKVNDVDDVLSLAQADEEVVRLHISVDEALRVNVFQPAQQLRSQTPFRKARIRINSYEAIVSNFWLEKGNDSRLPRGTRITNRIVSEWNIQLSQIPVFMIGILSNEPSKFTSLFHVLCHVRLGPPHYRAASGSRHLVVHLVCPLPLQPLPDLRKPTSPPFSRSSSSPSGVLAGSPT